MYYVWFAASAGAVPLESWEDKIPNANQRFKVLSEFEGAAVLDKETQLVWEQSPLTTFHTWDFSAGVFESALTQCTTRTTGGRKGWRLPSVHELASLVDPANSNRSLPTGHPFANVQSAFYWSATSSTGTPTSAWIVFFNDGVVGQGHKAFNGGHAWCVRGGMNADTY